MKLFCLFSLALFGSIFISCKESHSTIVENKETNVSNESVKFNLIHCVLLNLKNDITPNDLSALKSEIKELEKIEVLRELEIGEFKNLDDPRAMSQLELIFTMAFKDDQDYQTYQNHPIHLELKSKVGKYLEGPPVTYDYLRD